jgi:hypothetical protein
MQHWTRQTGWVVRTGRARTVPDPPARPALSRGKSPPKLPHPREAERPLIPRIGTHSSSEPRHKTPLLRGAGCGVAFPALLVCHRLHPVKARRGSRCEAANCSNSRAARAITRASQIAQFDRRPPRHRTWRPRRRCWPTPTRWARRSVSGRGRVRQNVVRTSVAQPLLELKLDVRVAIVRVRK